MEAKELIVYSTSYKTNEGAASIGTSTEYVSLGKVFELLLSAVHLHKKAFKTLLSMIGDKTISNTACKNAFFNIIKSISSEEANENSMMSLIFVDNASGKFINYNTKDQTELVTTTAEVWTRLRSNPAIKQPQKAIEVLESILKDGLLDSILPYIVSTLSYGSGTSSTSTQTKSSGVVLPIEGSDKKSVPIPSPRPEIKEEIASPPTVVPNEVNEPEAKPEAEEDQKKPEDYVQSTFSESNRDKGPLIVIHVCDEAHGLRQDFMCLRDLLINHIGYFSDLASSQRLEDVDISVHCDINIFDWLLKWIKHQDCPSLKCPVLEPKNAVSILISAEFLKMDPLTREVLKFIHKNTNNILEAQVSVSCLTDAMLSRLARLYTHWELESLKDPKDKLQNKLYSKFLQMLCDYHPLPSKGIYKTAAHIYRCSGCGKIIHKSVEKLIECVPANTFLTVSGTFYFHHSRDLNWNLTDHVKLLKQELKSWRFVYWRLWGEIHYLPCSTCGLVFPGTEIKQCRYHRSEPHFRSTEALDSFMSSVEDSFPCCDARALRFSPLPLRNGCQLNDHTVQLTRRHNEIWGPIPQIYDDLLSFQHLISTEPLSKTAAGEQKALWKDVSLIPPTLKLPSFIDRSWFIDHRSPKGQSLVTKTTQEEGKTANDSSQCLPESVNNFQNSEGCDIDFSDGEEEEGQAKRMFSNKVKAMLLRRATRAKTSLYCTRDDAQNLWDTTRSTRYNQDAQRDRETRLFRELISWLSLGLSSSVEISPCSGGGGGLRGKTKLDKCKKDSASNLYDPGNFYRLETEFREKSNTYEKSQGFTHAGGAFRAKVQAISRIKMRLRHRSAFSATR